MLVRRGCRVVLGVVTVVGTFVLLFRPLYLRWGATDDEREMLLPGDELIVDPDLVATRAITIKAPPDKVWPWVIQLGQGRGGFYTYDFLENLVGCDIHSADRVVCEWQTLEMGAEVNLAPEVPLVVAALYGGEALVLQGGVQMGSAAPPYDFTWAFVVKESAPRQTRLIVRERYAYNRAWAPLVVEPVEAISFLMTQKMLRGIRDRAENAARREPALEDSEQRIERAF